VRRVVGCIFAVGGWVLVLASLVVWCEMEVVGAKCSIGDSRDAKLSGIINCFEGRRYSRDLYSRGTID